ncbi:hypothetical protein HHK36_007114 [Tetracentron sinense]|uniref:Hexosyltransferase n=1 Tax=Tetracentron sinense TaxID=13715 RepID=A0A835DPP0_TETSI|nr:hypothetical protein HHK36_007114 [Tetracentron sinense]
MSHLRSTFSLIIIVLVFLLISPSSKAIRSLLSTVNDNGDEPQMRFDGLPRFAEAPKYRNGVECPVSVKGSLSSCNPFHVHITMTLDAEYLRGSIATVHFVLKHTSCPENVFFHFIAADEDLVKNLISSSIRQALENPLNYARSYLADILEPCVNRVIYLDSDLVVVDDIKKLWSISLTGSRTIGAGRKLCYFNKGVMVMDLVRWREGNFRRRIEYWMEFQKQRRIYELGSLPPFLLVFAGDVVGIDHRWNQHGLGGDNVVASCRSLHSGSVSLLHWSWKGKPYMDETRCEDAMIT